jgi:hypothetical protein
MRPDSITLAVFEKYSAEEMADTANKLVQALADIETAETEKKMSDAVFKERINKHEAEASELAKTYGKGGETAQIGCTIRYDVPTVGKKSYIRMDREETIEVHDMSLEEKQETLQFPLTASTEPKSEESPAPELPLPVEIVIKSNQPLTFKDIQAIAANIVKLPDEHRLVAALEMQEKISAALLAQQTTINLEGEIIDVLSEEVADKLAADWLELATRQATEPASAEETTRLCPYPACILFAEHDGEHEFPKGEEPADAAPPAEPEPQRQAEKKRKKRNPPPCQEMPGGPQ